MPCEHASISILLLHRHLHAASYAGLCPLSWHLAGNQVSAHRFHVRYRCSTSLRMLVPGCGNTTCACLAHDNQSGSKTACWCTSMSLPSHSLGISRMLSQRVLTLAPFVVPVAALFPVPSACSAQPWLTCPAVCLGELKVRSIMIMMLPTQHA